MNALSKSLAALALLFLTLPAHADGVAQIFICPKEVKECNQETARIMFTIHVESAMPTTCFKEVEKSLSKTWADIASADEVPKIRCGR